ncbi:MAG TPA: twin-arginine translocase TatA/TatE family subunit [Anaeromyxobacter sp.]|nr:twin-arginine translocase TatA/TatE family subunit [Anaeromyxobacter sp.]
MGFVELLLILFLVLLFFGAGRLGGIGGALGKSLRNVKDAVSGGQHKPPPASGSKGELPPPRS